MVESYCKVGRMAPPSRLLLATLLLTACPTTSSHAPEERCARAGQTCKLDQGLLGVCSETASDCDGAACLVCMSQH